MGEYLKGLVGMEKINSHIPLNEIFNYQYDNESKRVFLHLNTSSVSNLNPIVIKNLWRGCLNNLLRELKQNISLKNAESIVARSWIVRDHPSMFTRCGFTIDSKNPDFATISVYDFLNS